MTVANSRVRRRSRAGGTHPPEAARAHAVDPRTLESRLIERLQKRYGIASDEIAPRAYWRLTDNWGELTVRFLAHDHGIRHMKIAREPATGSAAVSRPPASPLAAPATPP